MHENHEEHIQELGIALLNTQYVYSVSNNFKLFAFSPSCDKFKRRDTLIRIEYLTGIGVMMEHNKYMFLLEKIKYEGKFRNTTMKIQSFALRSSK